MAEARSDAENRRVDEMLAEIEATGLTAVPLDAQLADAELRIEMTDRALVDARGVLVATRDLDFQPDGWEKPVGETVTDLVVQRERLVGLRGELRRRVAEKAEAAPEE